MDKPIPWGPARWVEPGDAVSAEIGHIGVTAVIADDKITLGWTIHIAGDGATLPTAESILADVAEIIEVYIARRTG